MQFLAIAPRHNVKRAIETLKLVQQSLAGNDCNVNAQVLLSVQNTITDLNLALAELSVTYHNPIDSACTAVSELYAFRHLSVDENQAGFVKSDTVTITSHRTPRGKISHQYKGKEGIVVGHTNMFVTTSVAPHTGKPVRKRNYNVCLAGT